MATIERRAPAAFTLHAFPVETPEHVETLRQLRNAFRHYMTRTRLHITQEAQRRWWDDRNPDRLRVFLYILDGSPVGYGLARRDDGGRWWLTGGLVGTWRGQRLGAQIFEHLEELVGLPCWLEVLASNARALGLYARLGYKVDHTRPGGEVLVMVKK